MSYLLALDEGTTSARAALYDTSGHRIAMEAAPVRSHHPYPGWVEQDALEIWQSQLTSARRVLDAQHVDPASIAALGITNQRETVVVWERATGLPVNPAIVWQCRRTADFCAELARTPVAEEIRRRTGLVMDAYFSASKIRWVLENVADARSRAADGELLCGTVDSWLVWKLTNGAVHITDVSNASRTMLMDLATDDWSGELLSVFGVPRAMLPRIVPSSGVVGVTAAEHLGAEMPIAGIAGDQQAALVGQACRRPGLCKNTYGTGCFALLHTGSDRPLSQHRLLTTRVASGEPTFALEGSVFVAGAAVQWVRDRLGLIANAAESELVARSVTDTGGVYLVPAFVGLGAPHWDAQARGVFTGMTLATGRAELVRATLESIAYQTRELVEAMQADSGGPLVELRVDGGAAGNDFLMQFQADLLGCTLVRPVDTETTALGAAILAAEAVRFFPEGVTGESIWQRERTFEPAMGTDRREALYDGWKRAVRQCRAHAAAGEARV